MCKLQKDNLGYQGSRGKANVEREKAEGAGSCVHLSRDEKDVSQAVHCCAGEVKSEEMRSWPKGLVALYSFF